MININDFITVRDYIFEGDPANLPSDFFNFIKENPTLTKYYYIEDVFVAIRMIYNGCLCGYIINPQLSFPKLTTTYFMRHSDKFDVHRFINFKEYNRNYLDKAPEDAFIIGFDCGHACDYLPNFGPDSIINKDKPYRSEQYVHEQLVSLIEQLKNK